MKKIKKLLNKLMKFGSPNNIKKYLKKILSSRKIKFITPPNDGKIRYNLGCGDKILEGYINVDCVSSRKGKKPDIVCNITKLKLKKNSADEIMAIHVIEHFYPWEAEKILNHWKSFLKPGGKIILECPNFLEAAKFFSKKRNQSQDNLNKFVYWPVYGDPSHRDPLMMHKWGYTPASLISLLKESGFEDVVQAKAIFKQQEPRDMRVTGVKSHEA